MPPWTETPAQTFFVSDDLAGFVVPPLVPVTWVHVSLALMQQNQEKAGSRAGADCQASPLR